MKPLPRVTGQPDDGWLIMLDSMKKGATLFLQGNVLCSGEGFAFPAYKFVSFVDLQNILLVAIVSHLTLPPSRVLVPW